MEVQVALNHWWANELTPQQRAGIIMGEGEGGRFNPRTFRVLIDEAIRRLQEQQQGGRRKKKTRKKRGRGKCVSKPKYHDEEEIDKRIAENIKHMNIQSQKLEEIINASTCEDGTVDLKQMLENIKKHKGGRRKKKSRRRK